MITLDIDLSDVLDETHDDDVVVVWPPAHREGSRGQVIAPRKRTIPLVGGKATVQVEPGPLNVQIRAQDGRVDGEVRRLTVPEEGPVTLADLLDSAGAFTYAPPVLGQVAQMRDAAEDAAMRAEGVADTFGSLEGVVDQVQAAEAAASSAEADRLVVEQAATSASWSGDRLTVLGATSPPLTGEPGPAGAAPYVGANGNWWVGDTDTGVRAQGDKGDSGDGAGDVLWSELNPVLDGKAPVSHDHTVEQVTGLQGELDGKAPVSHDHTVEQVTGLQSALDGKAPVSHTHALADISGVPDKVSATNVGSTIATRNADGNLGVSDPTHPIHAANQRYVDQVVGEKADAGHTHTSANITDARTWTGRSTDSNAIVMTDSGGWFFVASDPTHGSHPTNKSYVDGGLAGKADTSHEHRVLDFPMTDRTNWINNSSHPGKFVYTRPDGYLHGDVPTDTSHVANKAYVDARTPEIRAVTTIPTPTTPGVVYLRFG